MVVPRRGEACTESCVGEEHNPAAQWAAGGDTLLWAHRGTMKLLKPAWVNHNGEDRSGRERGRVCGPKGPLKLVARDCSAGNAH